MMSSFIHYRMFRTQEVINNSKNQALFRHIARETTGESYQPPEGDRLFFGNLSQNGNRQTIGAACYTRADRSCAEIGDEFLSPYCHILNYIFIKGYFQEKGYGSKLLKCVEKDMLSKAKRPIRIQSANGAVKFFERHGYRTIGDPIDCSLAGSAKFHLLHNMEKKI